MPNLIINDSIFNVQSIILGLKTCIFCFLFVWMRATLPRMRFDALIKLCWGSLLPFCFAFISLIPCLIMTFDIGIH